MIHSLCYLAVRLFSVQTYPISSCLERSLDSIQTHRRYRMLRTWRKDCRWMMSARVRPVLWSRRLMSPNENRIFHINRWQMERKETSLPMQWNQPMLKRNVWHFNINISSLVSSLTSLSSYEIFAGPLFTFLLIWIRLYAQKEAC